jgi:hypothetical protein
MDQFLGLDNPTKGDKNTVLLTTTHDDVEKMIICGILEEEKIPFLAKDRGAGEAVRVVTGYSMYGCDIFVPAALYEKANALLDDYRNGEPIFDDDEIVEEDDPDV